MAINEKQRTHDVIIPCGVEHRGFDMGKKCHFILRHDTEPKIFQLPFLTESDAKATLSFYNLSGYHIEHKINQVQHDDVKREQKEQREQKPYRHYNDN